jgi:endo-1,4-beta-xylanase
MPGIHFMKSLAALIMILLLLCGCAEQSRDGEPASPTTLPEPTLTGLPETEVLSEEPEEFLFPLSPEDEEAYTSALQDIEQYRKGDVTIAVASKEGTPLPNVTVEYHQIEHSFLFGIFTRYSPDIFQLMKEAGINYVTFHFNWQATEPQETTFDFRGLEYTWGVNPLCSQGFTLKAHALTWMTDEVTPEYMRNVSFQLYKEKSYQHIYEIVSHFKESVHIWNVINEPMAEWANIYNLSEEQVGEAITTGVEAIRKADPQGRIIINNASPAGENYIIPPYDFLKGLKADYDIIGLQMYYNGYTQEYEAPRRSLAYLASLVDQFSTLEKEIHITELSVPSDPIKGRKGYWEHPWSEELQAQYAQVAYTLFFSKKDVKALTWWDASDATSFIYHGGLLDENNSPKRIYYTLRNLIHSWTTHGTQVTDANGRIAFRGFGGLYEVNVTDNETGLVYTGTLEVKEQKINDIHIVIDPETLQKEHDQKRQETREELNNVVTDIKWLLDYWKNQGRDMTVQEKELEDILTLEPEEALEKAVALRLQVAITKESVHSWETFENTNRSLFDLSQAKSGVLLTSGALHKSISLKEGRIAVRILAKGDEGGGAFPSFFIMAGSSISDVIHITSSQWQWYEVVLDIEGAEDIALIFTNDYYDPSTGEDRNLYIQQVVITEYLFFR